MLILRVMNFNNIKKIFLSNRNAFTLLEILIVITIIGIGVITLTPQMMRNTVENDNTVTFFNKTLEDALTESRELQAPVSIRGFKGSDNIITAKGERVKIPDDVEVSEVEINEYNTFGTEYEITVYPSGICDYFIINFNNGEFIESTPLLMTVKKYAKK